MKDKGEYMTKAQLKKKRAAEARRAELIANGTIKPGDVDDDEDEQPKTSVIKNTRKKNKNKAQADETEKQPEQDEADDAVNTSEAAPVDSAADKTEAKKA